jgi:hypothetical protein
MGLVTAKEVANKCWEIWGFRNLFRLVINESTKISTLNKFYDRNKHLKDIDFLNAIIDDLQIKFDIPDEDFKRLPKDGAYIISNHPLVLTVFFY